MREIGFRGKRIDNGKWIYGWLRQTGHQDIEKSNGQYVRTERYYQIQDKEYNSQFVNETTVGQYTGLKDKNGKKIFEGDIVSLGDKKILYIVEWIDNGFQGRQNGNSSTVGLTYWNSDIEVIGNIYDNSKLLEVES